MTGEQKKELEELMEVLGLTTEWLTREIPGFNGKTPSELIKDGRVDEVIVALAASETGVS